MLEKKMTRVSIIVVIRPIKERERERERGRERERIFPYFFESLSCSGLSGMTAAYLYTILPRFLPRGRKWLSAQSRWGAAGRGSSVRIHGAEPLMRG